MEPHPTRRQARTSPALVSGAARGLPIDELLEAPEGLSPRASPSRRGPTRRGARLLQPGPPPPGARMGEAEVDALAAQARPGAMPGLGGKLLSPRQMERVLVGPALSEKPEDARLWVMEQLLLHLTSERDEGSAADLVRLFPEAVRPRAQALVDALPTLEERRSLLLPEYPNLYRYASDIWMLPGRRAALTRLLNDEHRQTPLRLTSTQVRELLLLFPPEDRLERLEELWSHWSSSRSRETVLAVLPEVDHAEARRRFVDERVSAQLRASERAMIAKANPFLRELFQGKANHGVPPSSLLGLMGHQRVDAHQVRQLLRLITPPELRLQALEGLLPFWDGSGETGVFLEVLDDDQQTLGAELVDRRCWEVEGPGSLAFYRAQKAVTSDAVTRVLRLAPPPLDPEPLRSTDVARLLHHYPADERLRPLRLLLLHWAPDGDEHVLREVMRGEPRRDRVDEALEVASLADRTGLDDPGYRSFLAEAQRLTKLDELRAFCRPPSPLRGLMGRLGVGTPPRQLTSLQLRHFLSWADEGHAILLLEALGTTQWRRDGNEAQVLGLFDRFRTRAEKVLAAEF